MNDMAQQPIQNPEYFESTLRKLTDKKVCMGNSDDEFIELVMSKGGVIVNKGGNTKVSFLPCIYMYLWFLSCIAGKTVARISSTPYTTVRHSDCSILLHVSDSKIRCNNCDK